MTTYAFNGDGPLFDKGEIICPDHAGFRLDYRTESWTEAAATEASKCFICAEDANIAAGEKAMNR